MPRNCYESLISTSQTFIRHDEYSLEPVKMGGSPVIVVEKKPKPVHVKRATTLDEFGIICNYVSTLEVGFPVRAFDEVNSYDELFKLAGIRRHDQVVCLHQAKLHSTAKKKGLRFYPDIDHPSPWD